MIKRFLLIIFLFFILFAAGAYVILNTALVTPRLLGKIIAENYPQFHVEKIDLAEQKYTFPNELNFKQIKTAFKENGQAYTVEINDLNAKGILTAWRSGNELEFKWEGALLRSKEINLSGLAGNLRMQSTGSKINEMNGNVRLQTVAIKPYEIQNVFFLVQNHGDGVILKNLSAEAYGSQWKGEILLEYPPSLSYSIQLEFKDLDVSRLREINAGLPAQVEGVFAGTIIAQGKQDNLDKLDFKVQVVKRGKIRASLLNFVTQYIPASQEREHLEKILARDGKISVEQASVDLKSLSSNKLTALIKLFSRELNLDQNFVIDINSDGKITSLLEYLDQLSVK